MSYAPMSSTDGPPRTITWRGRAHTVTRVLETWRVGGRWWRGEAPSDHYRLEVEGGATLRVRRREGAWEVEGVDD